MVFYIVGRGITGFSIYSENNEISLGVPNFNIQVPIETIIETRNFNDKITHNGKIKLKQTTRLLLRTKLLILDKKKKIC